MAPRDPNLRPIIIKKIKKGGHAHHGGAWKVAYADFVTAMMAFFLLLWLLSSVDQSKLEGLAEYFTPTVGLKDSMGIGFEGGETVNEDGKKKSDKSPPGIVTAPPPGQTSSDAEKKALVEGEKDAQLFEKAEENMKQAFESDPNLRDLAENIVMEQTPEGLKIDITDSDRHPMFDPGSITLTEFGMRILAKMSLLIEQMPNYISITGHTDASPMTSRGADYTNWELSSDRANAARRYLIRSGVQPQRPRKVTGQAAAELLVPEQPTSPRNRRITIILLRGSYLDLGPDQLPAPRDLLNISTPPPMPKSTPLAPKAPAIKAPEPVMVPGQAAPIDKNPVGALSTPEGEISTPRTPSKADMAPSSPGAPTAVAPTTAPAKGSPQERTRDDYKPFVDHQ